jgi:sensor domain CHASE-containing protein
MRKPPDTPQGTVVLIAIFMVLTLVLWFNAYFIVLSRGAN